MANKPTREQQLTRIAELRLLIEKLLKRPPVALQPLVRRQAEKVIADMEKFGYPVMVYQGFRSKAEQDYLYAQGRTRPGAIVTNAKGGYSLHNYGCAVDIVFIENGRPSWAEKHPWTVLGHTLEKHGFEWGGRWTSFSDRPHGQITFGYTLYDFLSNKVDYKKYV